ncbi:hypothetical protein C8F04DRAFT_1398570 [Mycena alexandri]|uniref:Uncharacterized protein n=1 Tax=Mycena alexandri TaxID=1745969 RepID=A0AAD6WVR8_9AGAR|nr:hypothetical protein C8F04DRAFT_1398570 [Mycena alexandri]
MRGHLVRVSIPSFPLPPSPFPLASSFPLPSSPPPPLRVAVDIQLDDAPRRRGVLAFPRRALLRQSSTVHGVSFETSSPARLCMHAARSRAGFLLPPTCTISSLRPSLSPMYPFPPPPLVIAPFCEQLGDVPIPTSRTPTLNVSAIPRPDAEAHRGATAARFEAINPETMIFFLPPKVQICQWRRPTPSLCGENARRGDGLTRAHAFYVVCACSVFFLTEAPDHSKFSWIATRNLPTSASLDASLHRGLG